MNDDEVTLKFASMEEALMFRAAIQTLTNLVPMLDEAIRHYAHLETTPADKGEI